MTATSESIGRGESRLLAGAATSNITPALGVSLDGPIGQNGPATHIHDELHARCLVLSDGSTTLGIAVCDSTMIPAEVFDAAKAMVSEHTGIPASHLMMSATHSHSVPRAGIGRGPLDKEYLAFLSRRIADGIRRAQHQLAPARLGVATIEEPEHVNNRRWVMKPGAIPPNPFGDTGDKVKMNPQRGSPDLVRPAGPVDPRMVLLSVQHEDGRPLALLANYGLHYVGGVPRGDISADYFGMFSDVVEDALGDVNLDPPFVGMLSNGASGNVNNVDFRAPAEPLPPYVKMRLVAADLASAALAACAGIDHREQVTLAATANALDLQVRRPDGERLEWARSVMAAAEGKERLNLVEVFAREALFLAQYPESVAIPMQAFRIGAVGIAAIPCEVFAETGLAIKRASPFATTFVMSLANGYHGYLPTPEQHELGGYETWPARSSCLAVDAATDIREEALRQLGSL